MLFLMTGCVSAKTIVVPTEKGVRGLGGWRGEQIGVYCTCLRQPQLQAA